MQLLVERLDDLARQALQRDFRPIELGGQLIATYSDSKSPSRAGIECSPEPCFLPDSFVVFDVVGWWKITDALTARAGVFNVSDEKYWWWSDVRDGLPAAVPFIDAYSQPGRSASLAVAMQF